jgi:DNA-binding NarL/FixJ family response regulator
MLNVLIADAHPVARNGLHLLVERLVAHLGDECVVAFSADALTAFRKAKRLQPDLILLNAHLPLSSGLEALLALRQYTPNAKLVIVSDGERAAPPRSYLDAGADGVLRKTQSEPELEDALRRVLRGETYPATP